MRGKPAPKRDIKPDFKYQRADLGKLINYVMRHGKKSTAETLVYGCLDIISEKTKKDPIDIYDRAIKNVGPAVEVRGRRVGGANYQVPFPVRNERKFTLACRWILDAAKKRKGKTMAAKLAEELIDASNESGEAFKKRMDNQKMAEANRAFAHFAR